MVRHLAERTAKQTNKWCVTRPSALRSRPINGASLGRAHCVDCSTAGYLADASLCSAKRRSADTVQVLPIHTMQKHANKHHAAVVRTLVPHSLVPGFNLGSKKAILPKVLNGLPVVQAKAWGGLGSLRFPGNSIQFIIHNEIRIYLTGVTTTRLASCLHKYSAINNTNTVETCSSLELNIC